jgi:hypothetical protein
MSHFFTIKEISREEFDRSKRSFASNPFLEPFWVESFKNDGVDTVYFCFMNDGQTVGIAGGLQVESRNSVLKPISRFLYLFGMPEIQGGQSFPIGEFKRYLKRNGYNSLHIGSYYNLKDHRLRKSGFLVRHREEYIIDLSRPLPEIWGKLSKSRKRRVNKAKKAGLVFNESHNADKIRDLISCLDETKCRKSSRGFGDYDYHYMPFINNETLIQLLKTENLSISYVACNNRILGADLVARNNCSAYSILSGATKEGYELSAPTYLLWRIIERAKEAGCETLNLGGLPKDETSVTLAQFKRSFGAEAKLCEGGSCYLNSGPQKLLHRCYKLYFKSRHIYR